MFHLDSSTEQKVRLLAWSNKEHKHQSHEMIYSTRSNLTQFYFSGIDERSTWNCEAACSRVCRLLIDAAFSLSLARLQTTNRKAWESAWNYCVSVNIYPRPLSAALSHSLGGNVRWVRDFELISFETPPPTRTVPANLSFDLPVCSLSIRLLPSPPLSPSHQFAFRLSLFSLCISSGRTSSPTPKYTVEAEKNATFAWRTIFCHCFATSRFPARDYTSLYHARGLVLRLQITMSFKDTDEKGET